jgi:hypothetical protein
VLVVRETPAEARESVLGHADRARLAKLSLLDAEPVSKNASQTAVRVVTRPTLTPGRPLSRPKGAGESSESYTGAPYAIQFSPERRPGGGDRDQPNAYHQQPSQVQMGFDRPTQRGTQAQVTPAVSGQQSEFLRGLPGSSLPRPFTADPRTQGASPAPLPTAPPASAVPGTFFAGAQSQAALDLARRFGFQTSSPGHAGLVGQQWTGGMTPGRSGTSGQQQQQQQLPLGAASPGLGFAPAQGLVAGGPASHAGGYLSTSTVHAPATTPGYGGLLGNMPPPGVTPYAGIPAAGGFFPSHATGFPLPPARPVFQPQDTPSVSAGPTGLSSVATTFQQAFQTIGQPTPYQQQQQGHVG